MTSKTSEFWVRDDAGNTYGPISFSTVELFVESGMFKAPVTASTDGLSFDVPGNLPELRDAFPRIFWGTDDEKASVPRLVSLSGPRLSIPSQARTLTPAPAPLGNPAAAFSEMPDAQQASSFGGRDALFDAGSGAFPGGGAVPSMGFESLSGASSSQIPPAAPAGIGRLPFSGDITFDLPPLCLCHRAVSEKATGLLTLQNSLRCYSLFFQKGVLESVSSPRQEEDLGAFAVAQKKLTDSELDALRAKGGDIVDAIFSQGVLPSVTAMELLNQHRMSLLFKAILVSEGSFWFDANAPRPTSGQMLGDRWTPFCQAARAIPRDKIIYGLGYRVARPVMASGGWQDADISQLSLTAQERRIMSKFDGTKSLIELCGSMPEGQALPILRTAYLLACFEVISFASSGGEGAAAVAGFQHRFLRGSMAPMSVERTSTPQPFERMGTQPPRFGTNPPQRFGTNPPQRFGSEPHTTPASGTRFGTNPPQQRFGTANPNPSAAPTPRFGTNPPQRFGSEPHPTPASGTRFGTNPTPTPRVATPSHTVGVHFGTPAPSPRFASDHTGVSAEQAAAAGQRFGTNRPAPVAPSPRFGTNSPFHSPSGGTRFGTDPAVSSAAASDSSAVRRPTVPPVRRMQTENPKPPVSSAGHEGEIAELKAQLESLSKKNHFEALSVEETASGSAFKLAFFKLAKKYHPDTAIGAPPEVAELKAAVFARLNEAYQVLDNPKSRAEYLESIQNGGTGEKVDVASVLAAEEKYMKAVVCLKARKYKDALSLMEAAVALNDKEGEFWAGRGFASFMASQNKQEARAGALSDIEKGLERNPRCAEAYFYRGQVEKISGDKEAARAAYQKALELQPGHQEAQRELRWLGQ